MVDERLTSQDAKSSLRDASIEGESGRVDLTKIDHLAAALILQSWLDQPELGQQPSLARREACTDAAGSRLTTPLPTSLLRL